MNIENTVCQPTNNTKLVTRRKWIRGEIIESRTIIPETMKSFIVRLVAAGSYGLHTSEFRRDKLARMQQIGLQFELFSSPVRGTGNRDCWLRLFRFGDDFDYFIASSMAATQ